MSIKLKLTPDLRSEYELKARLHGWEQKFPMKTNREGTTSTFSKPLKTVSKFPIVFSKIKRIARLRDYTLRSRVKETKSKRSTPPHCPAKHQKV